MTDAVRGAGTRSYPNSLDWSALQPLTGCETNSPSRTRFVDDRGRYYSARVLGWDPAARKALGIRPAPHVNIDRDRIRQLMLAGWSVRQIARATGLKRTMTHRLMHEVATVRTPDLSPDSDCAVETST